MEYHNNQASPIVTNGQLELSDFTRMDPKMAANSTKHKTNLDPTVANHGKDFVPKSERTFLEHFKQQSLPAWRPVYTALRLSPALFIIGLVFIPIGAAMWVLSDKVKEVSVPYTDCANVLQNYPEDYSKPCSDVISDIDSSLKKSCKCIIKFTLSEELPGTVYIYYSLTNFYQNHRKYVSSRDDSQLRGKTGDAEEPNEPADECAPFDYEEDEVNGTRRIYFPCGAIANSMFSDKISLVYNKVSDNDGKVTPVNVPLNRTGIAWESDKKYKFENPSWFQNYSTSPVLKSVFVKPKYWKQELWELDPDDPDNNGLKNEDLIVWMRVAALPNFRKLFRIMNRHDEKRTEFANGMPKGEYELEIDYNFPVKMIHGTKTIVFTTKSVLGSSGSFLGMAYVITGSVCVVLAIFLLIVHVRANTSTHKFNRSQKIH